MSAAAALVEWLAAHGGRLALGASAVLVLAVLATAGCRDPRERHRRGWLGALAAALYLLAAPLPLPRLAWRAAPPADTAPAPTAATAAAAAPADPAARLAALQQQLDGLLPAPAPAPATGSTVAPAAGPTAAATWLAAGWLGLAVLFAGRAGLGALRLCRLLRGTRPGPAELAAAAGLPAGALRLCDADVMPFCAGLRRPVVVLPAALAAPAHRRTALAVLRHEAAHLAAGDPRVRVLLALLAVPLGAHPLFWWLARDVRFQSERLADAAAATAGGAAGYARDLLALAEGPGRPFAAPLAVPVFQRRSELSRRIQMLLQAEVHASLPLSWRRRAAHHFATGLLVAAAAMLCGVEARAQDPGAEQLRREAETLRAEVAALRAELAKLRGTAAAGRPADAAPTPGQPPSDVPQLLQDLPVVGRVFLPGPDGLPTQSVEVAPPPRQLPTGTSDAVADLVTRSLDLQAEIQIATAEAEEREQLAKAGHTTQLDAKRAQVRLHTLLRKRSMVQQLIQGEIQATELELEWLQRQAKQAGDKTEKLRLEILIRRTRMRLDALRSA